MTLTKAKHLFQVKQKQSTHIGVQRAGRLGPEQTFPLRRDWRSVCVLLPGAQLSLRLRAVVQGLGASHTAPVCKASHSGLRKALPELCRVAAAHQDSKEHAS